MRPTARDLAAGIHFAFRPARGTEYRGRRQLQAAAFWCWRQDVGLLTHRLKLQTGTLQQSGKTLFDREVPGKTRTGATTDERRIH